MLRMHLDRLERMEEQIARIGQLLGEAMKPYADAVARLAEVNGFGVDSAQQFISEVGVEAATFASPEELAHWVGVCPGQNESAEENQSSRSPKGNPVSAAAAEPSGPCGGEDQGQSSAGSIPPFLAEAWL
jgi:transposase